MRRPPSIPGAHLRLEVPAGGEACGIVVVGPTPGGVEDPLLQEVRVEFPRPLTVLNPAEALSHLHRRYRERDLIDWLAGLPPPWNDWARAHAGLLRDRLSNLVQAPVAVTLAAVTLRATQAASPGRFEMRPAFSGRVRLATGVSWPFSEVVLPTSVLPAFHASLARVFFGDLVATRASRGEREDSSALVRSLWNLAARVDTEVEARLTLPALAWQVETPDRTHLRVESRASDPRVVLKTRVRATLTRSRLDLLPSVVEVRAEDPADRSVRVEVRGRFRPDFGGRAPLLGSRSRGGLFLRILPGSSWPDLGATLDKTHPLTAGRIRLAVRVSGGDLRGRLAVVRDRRGWVVTPAGAGVHATARIAITDPEVLVGHDDALRLTLDRVTGKVGWRPARPGWRLDASVSGGVALTGATRLAPLPELRILDPVLRTDLAFRVRGEGRVSRVASARRHPSLVVSASARAVLARFVAELDGRRLEIPAGAAFTASLDPADAPARAARISWDLRGRAPTLRGSGRSAVLLADDLLRGDLTVHVSPGGRLSFRGERSGLYGAAFFNALLDPASEPRHLLDLLLSDSAMSHVIAAIEVFNPDLAQGVARVHGWVRDTRERLRHVKAPADVIPPTEMTRVLSILLVGDDRWAARLRPVVESVTEGRGLPKTAAAAVLRDVPALEGRDYEVGAALRWLDLVLKAGEPLPPAKPIPAEPLATDPAYASARRGFPSAAEILAATEVASLPLDEQDRIARAAPRMTLQQVEALADRARGRWRPDVVRFLDRVCRVKRRVAEVSHEGYGGLAHAGQAAAIASLIGDAVGPLPGLDEAPDSRPPCALGPAEIAVLLQVGLSRARQGTQTQINNRLLMECLRSQPRDLTREVLIEMGHQVDSALAGVLFAFLSQDQDRMAVPLDLPAFLEERLGLEVPRQEEYLAGGRRAGESYFEALARLAARVMEDAPPLLARRAHIQEVRHPLRTPPHPTTGRAAALEREARRAIAAADRLAGRLTPGSCGGGPARDRAGRAYETAFAACAEFLREVPDGFTLPWFRAFWARNEEALRLLSVVRAFEEDHDDVRRWMRVVSGRDDFYDRSDLADAVIEVLWARPEDRAALRADPLVRLLLPLPEGHLRFTVIACMGVITDGERGRELEDAFRRLQERRGVRVIRAHTGLFRPLESNAAAVIRAIENATTPYGLLGYSQGCANALMAEHLLRSGTPGEQRRLDGLVCRNLLFSAANGSVHGTSGGRKFLRAMVEGEHFLKHYQATHSREAAQVLFRVLKAVLDSPGFLKTVAGAHSLTLERAMALHRDGQFRPDVPTSSTRGVVSLDRLPEALVYLHHCHSRLLPGAAHDSQVPVDEAVGHASRVCNAHTEALARCDMGSLPLALHHWAPLTAEVERVTTRSDRERAVYQGPKDLLVFPWIEVNARFGRIAYNRGGTRPDDQA